MMPTPARLASARAFVAASKIAQPSRIMASSLGDLQRINVRSHGVASTRKIFTTKGFNEQPIERRSHVVTADQPDAAPGCGWVVIDSVVQPPDNSFSSIAAAVQLFRSRSAASPRLAYSAHLKPAASAHLPSE